MPTSLIRSTIEAGLVALALAALPAPAAKAKSKDPHELQAREKYAQGSKAYDLGRFEEALKLFSDAYEAKALPGFLFNIGQCHRQLGNFERASFFYKRYLDLSEKRPKNARQVEKLIAQCDTRLAAQRKASEAEEAEAARQRALAEAEAARQKLITETEAARQRALADAESARRQKDSDAVRLERALAEAEAARQRAVADAESARRQKEAAATDAARQQAALVEAAALKRVAEAEAEAARLARSRSLTNYVPDPAAAALGPGQPKKDDDDAVYTRWWFWAGVGVLAAGTAATLVATNTGRTPTLGEVGSR